MKNQYLWYLVAFFAAVFGAIAIHVAAGFLDVPIKILTRDPHTAADVPAYYAYFSLMGSTIWLISASSTLMTAMLVRQMLNCRLSDNSTYRIILLGGILSMIMAVDDILLFHDTVAAAVGIPEILFYLFYGSFIGSIIYFSRGIIGSTPWILLIMALGCFALSSGIDLWKIFPEVIEQSEDVFKFCAIILWGFYFVGLSWDFIKSHKYGN